MGLAVHKIFNSMKGAKEAQQPVQPHVNLGDTLDFHLYKKVETNLVLSL